MKFITLSLLAIIVINIACNKNSSTTDYVANAVCTGTTPTYTNDVASILNTSCALSGCHSAGSSQAGINLSDYSSASSQFKNNSKNLASVHHASGVEAMPRNASKLSDTQISILDCWVKNGCPQ
ncbi:MAG: hypothetical protein R2831_03555 [Chitinophagaceae bacterium]